MIGGNNSDFYRRSRRRIAVELRMAALMASIWLMWWTNFRRPINTLTNEGNIYGSFQSTLTISNVAVADAGTYTLTASNAAGIAVSSGAILTVLSSIPLIIQQPASQTVLLVEATVQFAVAVDGSAPFTYQWQQNETNLTDGGGISGSLSPTLTINGASSASIGAYSVVVSNALGAASSTGAMHRRFEVAAPTLRHWRKTETLKPAHFPCGVKQAILRMPLLPVIRLPFTPAISARF